MAKIIKATNKSKKEMFNDVTLDLMYCPEPTYRFNKGDSVVVGNLKDPVVDEISEDGRVYIIDFTDVNNNYGNPILTPHQKRTFCWYNVRPISKNEESFIKNADVKIRFSNTTIESLISRVLHFGVDFNPEYQRGLVWSDKDKEALLDSVFNNIDIGKFALIHLGYSSEAMYQILDGKQRLTTLVDFYLNRFPYRGKYYNELSTMDKNWFKEREIAVGEMNEATEELILKYFIILNTTGHVVDKAHLEKVEKLLEEKQSDANTKGTGDI